MRTLVFQDVTVKQFALHFDKNCAWRWFA